MTKIKLNLLLASKNLSQQEFAKITGINKGTINRYCNNSCEKITIEHIGVICNYFNCTPNELFTFDNVPNTIMMSTSLGIGKSASLLILKNKSIINEIKKEFNLFIDNIINNIVKYAPNTITDIELLKKYLKISKKYDFINDNVDGILDSKLSLYYDMIISILKHSSNKSEYSITVVTLFSKLKSVYSNNTFEIYSEKTLNEMISLLKEINDFFNHNLNLFD